jgi:glucose/arabinose dehydrogenase
VAASGPKPEGAFASLALLGELDAGIRSRVGFRPPWQLMGPLALRTLALFSIILAFLWAFPSAHGSGLVVTTVLEGDADIAAFDFLPGMNEIAVVQQRTGHVLAVNQDTGATRLLLDISDRIKAKPPAEQGATGIAISPDYGQSGMIYLSYTDLFNRWTLSRFVRDREEVLLRVDRYAPYHPCGTLQFGPADHYLYACIGDSDVHGDPNGNSFNLEVLPGKILRLEVLGRDGGYGIPPDNPYANIPGVRPEIWASGLRNPWMFTFDSLSGAAFIPDVGWDHTEEINFASPVQASGASYGWPDMEGPTRLGTFSECESVQCSNAVQQTAPIYWYEHGDKACAVIGGAVYQATPSELSGAYLFGDLCSLTIRALRRTPHGIETADVGDLDAPPVSIRNAPDGSIFVAEAGGTLVRVSGEWGAIEPNWAHFLPPSIFEIANQKALIDTIRENAENTVILSVKDEASDRLSGATRMAMRQMGLLQLADLGYRDSYAAVLKGGRVVAEVSSSKSPVRLSSEILVPLGIEEVTSAGYVVGNSSSVVVKGTQYSLRLRGINLVIVGPTDVRASSLDTNQKD